VKLKNKLDGSSTTNENLCDVAKYDSEME